MLKIKNILKNNGVIAFPTDTVWGIGCLPENKKAVEKIYSIKSRDTGKPLILLGKNTESLLPYVEKLPKNAEKIIKKYFPGAVTLVLKKSSLTPDFVTAGFNTVGIRIPDCPIFIEMLEKCTDEGVLATTSANISGVGAVSTKEEVINSIGGKIDYILDGYGFVPNGTESTVVSVDEAGIIKILRQGAVEVKI
jgi:L-threonylcarbamoyladenylate synthase